MGRIPTHTLQDAPQASRELLSDDAWGRATASGWTLAGLGEAFACLGLAVCTSYFLNFAGTQLDPELAVPVGG